MGIPDLIRFDEVLNEYDHIDINRPLCVKLVGHRLEPANYRIHTNEKVTSGRR